MYDLYPYFTNDGSVGLFSPSEDDIYHSTYGALTESWEKFIIPSGLEQYLDKHSDVKILDLCYGIGYNTKTSLQVFINSCLKNEKEKNKLNNFKNNSKNSSDDTSNIATIDTDNISTKNNIEFSENCENLEKINNNTLISNGAIDADNISDVKTEEFCSKCLNFDDSNFNNEKLRRNILIDAVDIDKILINLSPFITKGISDNKLYAKYLLKKYFDKNVKHTNSTVLAQVKKMKKESIIPPPEKFKLQDEVIVILFLKLLKNNSQLFNEPILQMLLSQKKYSPFFSKYMINFARFCSNHGYNYIKNANNSTFLHNIYYRYISPSYKNAVKLLKNYKISLKFHQNDARRFILQTENKYNFIFLDAFTPAKCPSLWTIEFFKELYSHLEEDGQILTYSNSAAVRNALLLNGFCVGKIYDEKLKRFVGTIASKNGDLIEHALDEKDLALINSKAGVCYRDEYLKLDNMTILLNREIEVSNSNLEPSSHIMKGTKNAQVESL